MVNQSIAGRPAGFGAFTADWIGDTFNEMARP